MRKFISKEAVMTEKMNCWEFKKCDKEKTADCPAVLRKAGRYCWLVAGTMCGDKPQGIFTEKTGTCFLCDFWRYMRG